MTQTGVTTTLTDIEAAFTGADYDCVPELVRAGMDVLEPLTGGQPRVAVGGKVVIGTVKGDIHSATDQLASGSEVRT